MGAWASCRPRGVAKQRDHILRRRPVYELEVVDDDDEIRRVTALDLGRHTSNELVDEGRDPRRRCGIRQVTAGDGVGAPGTDADELDVDLLEESPQ